MKLFRTLTKLLTCTLIILLINTTCKACISCTWSGGWSCIYMAGVSCGMMGQGNGAYSDFGTQYCEDYAAIALPNSHSGLYVDSKNRATLEVNGNRINVASDKLELFVKTTMKNNEKPNNKEIVNFMKSDNGFVSQEALERIAKDFKIKIIKVKNLPKANYCPPCEDKNHKVPKDSKPDK